MGKVVTSQKFEQIVDAYRRYGKDLSLKKFHELHVLRIDPSISYMSLRSWERTVGQKKKEVARVLESQLVDDLAQNELLVKQMERNTYIKTLVLFDAKLKETNLDDLTAKDALSFLKELKGVLQGDRKLDIMEKTNKTQTSLLGMFLLSAMYGGIKPEKLEALREGAKSLASGGKGESSGAVGESASTNQTVSIGGRVESFGGDESTGEPERTD